MSFVERELAAIRRELADADHPHRAALLVAQQALAWALEPRVIGSPYTYITGSKAEPEGCSAPGRLLGSSGTSDQRPFV